MHKGHFWHYCSVYFVQIIKHGKVILCSNRKYRDMAERKAKFEQKHFKEKGSASDNIYYFFSVL